MPTRAALPRLGAGSGQCLPVFPPYSGYPAAGERRLKQGLAWATSADCVEESPMLASSRQGSNRLSDLNRRRQYTEDGAIEHAHGDDKQRNGPDQTNTERNSADKRDQAQQQEQAEHLEPVLGNRLA